MLYPPPVIGDKRTSGGDIAIVQTGARVAEGIKKRGEGKKKEGYVKLIHGCKIGHG